MRESEWLACAYFALFAVVTPFSSIPPGRRLRVAAGAIALAIGVVFASQAVSDTARDWLPHLYLVLGYWLPALLVPDVDHETWFERWLGKTDAAIRPMLPPVPRVVTPVFELAYLVCYPLVPAAFTVVASRGSVDDINRFWVAVLTAGYASYASLPWLLSRPPRLAVPAASDVAKPLRTASANVFVLGRVSHRLNTFPSGHVAVSWAAAAMVWPVSQPAGLAVALVAFAIAIGAAAGRYHYVVDVLLGVVVAAAAVALAVWG